MTSTVPRHCSRVRRRAACWQHLAADLLGTAAGPGLDTALRRLLGVDLIELCGRHLREKGVTSLVIANRSIDRARELAAQYDATAVTLADTGRHELQTAPVVLRAPPPAKKQKEGLRGRIEKMGKKVGAAVGDQRRHARQDQRGKALLPRRHHRAWGREGFSTVDPWRLVVREQPFKLLWFVVIERHLIPSPSFRDLQECLAAYQ